jgi:hypothetical protein
VFYRRKIILALLEMFDDRLDKISLQKLLFLFSRRQGKPVYDFVPYRFGCYSYSANADIATMVKKGLLKELDNSVLRQEEESYFTQLTPQDQDLIRQVRSDFGQMGAYELMKYTYIKYPYYAIHSEAADTLVRQQDMERIKAAIPQNNDTLLFTIGYEGISPEEYLNRLIKNDIKALVDVRNNPLSMKYGFSKGQLKKFCENLGILYFHFPELGIRSDHRKHLNDQSDYDKLFSSYRIDTLTKTTQSQNEVFELLKAHKRIALTCFEANVSQCHRKHLAAAIEKLPGFAYPVKHI